MINSRHLLFCTVGVFWIVTASADGNDFRRILLSEQFFGEGACFADIDGDGHTDVVSGPRWYRGPSFSKAFTYADGDARAIQGYSDYFFVFSHDFNHDDRPDILAIPIPGEAAHWFENPGQASEEKWKKHLKAFGRLSMLKTCNIQNFRLPNLPIFLFFKFQNFPIFK